MLCLGLVKFHCGGHTVWCGSDTRWRKFKTFAILKAVNKLELGSYDLM